MQLYLSFLNSGYTHISLLHPLLSFFFTPASSILPSSLTGGSCFTLMIHCLPSILYPSSLIPSLRLPWYLAPQLCLSLSFIHVFLHLSSVFLSHLLFSWIFSLPKVSISLIFFLCTSFLLFSLFSSSRSHLLIFFIIKCSSFPRYFLFV